MSRVETFVSKARASTETPWTEEQKAEYAAKWAEYARLFAGRRKGASRRFAATVIELGDAKEVPNTYPGVPPGTMRVVREIVVELIEPGLEGLRFYGETANNPQNPKTRLQQLVVAVTRQVPPERGSFSIDLDTLLNVPVMVELQKGNPREDGKRGGFHTKLVSFEELYEDEAPKAARPVAVAGPSTKNASANSAPTLPAATPSTPDTSPDAPDEDDPFN